MADKIFEFHIVLQGSGEDVAEAWDDAVSAFKEDPGYPDSDQIKEVKKEDYQNVTQQRPE